MKNLLSLFILLLCSSLAAQQKFSPFQDHTPTVIGQLKGYDAKVDADLKLSFVVVVPTPESQEQNTVLPNADGSFTFQLPHPLRYQQIWFSIGDHYYGQLIVDKGLEILADLDVLKKDPGNWLKDGVQFKGDDKGICEVVNRFVQYRREHKLDGENKMQIMMDRAASVEDKVERMKTLQAAEAEREAKYIEEYPSDWNWVLENERLSDFYGDLCVLHWSKFMAAALRKEILSHQPKLISNAASSYYGYQSNGLMFSTPAENVRNFAEILPPKLESVEEKERMIEFATLMERKNQKAVYDEALYKKESKYFFQQYKREIHQAKVDAFAEKLEGVPSPTKDFLIAVGGGEDIWERTYYVERMLPKVAESWVRNMMEKNWAVTKEKIKAVNEKLATIKVNTTDSPIGKDLGSLENGASFYAAEQEQLETLLGALRSSAGEKAVLFDIWATWCGPCLYDMKQSHTNIEKLEELGVEVIYICVASGTDQDSWQKKATELDLGTKHIFLSEDLSKQIMEYFELKGYPSHVFLDKNGKYHPKLVSSIRNIDLEKVKERL